MIQAPESSRHTTGTEARWGGIAGWLLFALAVFVFTHTAASGLPEKAIHELKPPSPDLGRLFIASLLSGMLPAALGTTLVRRDAIRWGVALPILAYPTGMLALLASGKSGAMTLLLASPLMIGAAIAAGLATAFFCDRLAAPDRA